VDGKKQGGNVAIGLIGGMFVWLIFDNLALGLLFALILGAGAAKARQDKSK
jgi:hypothetical protein